ncbi:MAG: hypothetical protein ABSA64_06800 [Sedimentisphaerales bacterium]
MDSRQISKIRHVADRRARFGNTKYEIRNGSAIILAIVLTTLLAILGVLFLLSSRVDSVATSAVGDNQDLKLAVDTVVAQISEVLTRNVPGVNPNGTYYNYPDDNNPWLASLEPNDANMWPHITDLYNQFGNLAYDMQIQKNEAIYDHSDVAGNGTHADADGDGAPDSLWIQIPNMNSSKGKPIFVAVRVIDNGGMLNINTGDIFNPAASVGAKQSDINLMALSWRPNNPSFPYNPAAESTLTLMRNPSSLPGYENDVIWQYGLPNGAYTPFDISDELEMRYCFVIDQNDIHTRLESWGNQFNLFIPGKPFPNKPFDNSTSPIPANVPRNWSTYARYTDFSEPNYAYRHIATTYNMDRIINPAGHKMLNINNPNITAGDVCDVVKTALLETGTPDADWLAAQIAVNLIDSVDTDSNVTTLVDANGQTHFGFETPCIYLSQIAQSFFKDPNKTGRSYAIELYKPYASDPFPDLNNKWQLVINDPCNPIPVYWPANSPFFVIANRDVNAAPLDINHVDANDVNDFRVVFDAGDRIWLKREIDINGTSFLLTVDWVDIPIADPCTGWLVESNDILQSTHSIKRDITLHKCIRRLWEDPRAGFLLPTALGSFNYRYVSPDPYLIQAHPANKPFTNIGEIGQLFRTDAYLTGPNDTEASVRLNIADRNFQNIFKYLTVMDPNTYTGDPNETRIKGRININTAPWFVLAQLPWVSYHTQPNYNLAQSIVNYRDTIHGPFKNIGELMTDANSSINSIGYYEGETMPIPTALLTPPDGVGDAFEERDVIFDRISNLITVRSDVFTAYILVRIGTDGPQKRVIAIFDRSGVTPTSGKVKIIAIQQVPDPR